ncbi:MAG: SDR family oxidoreductase [Myxococcales bacterium]|nr:SDR family oxidoreductase [Myxococcales bacterium]
MGAEAAMQETREGPIVAIAGATGNAGRAIVKEAARRGLSVRALVRDEARLGDARDACAEVRVVQVTDPASLRGALDGATYVISALGKTYQKDATPRREVDVEANRYLFEEAKRAGVARAALISVYGASHDHAAEMIRMKAEAEQALEESGVPFVIVQPSGFFSDMWEMFEMCRKGTLWTVGSDALRFNPISLSDLAVFTLDCLLDDARVGTRQPVGGPDALEVREIGALCGDILGREVRVRVVPLWLAKAGVGATRLFSRNLGQIGEFFVESAAFGLRHDVLAPAHGEEHLAGYLRERWAKERVAASG